MTSASFEATSSVLPEGAVIVLRGELDGGAREALVAAYDGSNAPGTLGLDFRHVTYINSSGLALIVELLSRARADRRPVAASGLSEHYREIFRITQLTDFMTILATEQPPTPARPQEQA